MITRLVAAVVAFAAMMWGASIPVAAHAADSYVAPAPVSVIPAVIEPGGHSTIEFSAGFFEPGEPVGTSVAGRHAVEAVVVDGAGAAELVSRADGGMTAVFVAPHRGSGLYSITFSASRVYVAVVTVTPAGAEHDPAGVLACPGPDLGVPPPGADADATDGVANVEQESPDREGKVQIPGIAPQAPEWPGLDRLPWSIVLLAAITLIATTVTATLVIAARRRG